MALCGQAQRRSRAAAVARSAWRGARLRSRHAPLPHCPVARGVASEPRPAVQWPCASGSSLRRARPRDRRRQTRPAHRTRDDRAAERPRRLHRAGCARPHRRSHHRVRRPRDLPRLRRAVLAGRCASAGRGRSRSALAPIGARATQRARRRRSDQGRPRSVAFARLLRGSHRADRWQLPREQRSDSARRTNAGPQGRSGERARLPPREPRDALG